MKSHGFFSNCPWCIFSTVFFFGGGQFGIRFFPRVGSVGGPGSKVMWVLAVSPAGWTFNGLSQLFWNKFLVARTVGKMGVFRGLVLVGSLLVGWLGVGEREGCWGIWFYKGKQKTQIAEFFFGFFC